MKRKITLKQIARELDVSISTVSKALRNSAEISDDTKQKVQAFAKLYNYRPNNIALSLKNRKTNTIGIIIPEIVHHFFSKPNTKPYAQVNISPRQTTFLEKREEPQLIGSLIKS